VVIPRLLTRLVSVGTTPLGRSVWGDDRLPLPENVPERWLNVFTGEILGVSGAGKILPMSSVLSICPVALLKSL
jgi:hypothetical protein